MSRWLHERLAALQKLGVVVGLAGVALVVGHRIDTGAIVAGEPGRDRRLALACVTAGTLYQRQFCADLDLRSAVCIHFAATAAVMLPLGVGGRGLRDRVERGDRAVARVPRRAGVDRRLLDLPRAAAPRPGDQRDEPALLHAAGRGTVRVGGVRLAADAADVDRHGRRLRRRRAGHAGRPRRRRCPDRASRSGREPGIPSAPSARASGSRPRPRRPTAARRSPRPRPPRRDAPAGSA